MFALTEQKKRKGAKRQRREGMSKQFFFASWRLCAFALNLVAFGAGASETHEAHPNVLILLADQWRAQAFGYAGDPNVKTPHIDALEKESVDFTHAISGVPVCCPARASLWTGQRALTHGVFLNDVPLATNAVTLAKVLRAQGYDTGYIGKWHLSGGGRSAFIPREGREGFDYWKVLECTHNYNHSYYYGDTPEKLEWPGYDAIAQTQDACDYLRTRAATNRPFLLVLSWGSPHEPYGTAPEKYRAMYNPTNLTLRGNVPPGPVAGWRRDLAGYYAHCTALDDCLGDVLQTLRDSGLDQHTIVIFTSDHGDMLGSHGMVKKQKPFDESICVPMLMKCPTSLGIKARRVDAVISSEDFMPTVLGLCSAPIPATSQGIDFSAYARGGRDPSDGTALISCIAPFSDWALRRGGREFRGLRTERFTYARGLDGPWILFDNEKDPLQLTNLVNTPGAATWQADLDKKLKAKLEQAHDAFLPAAAYIKQWGYTVDTNGTVPYTN
jgi:arylsulfatase A-like enzyme